MGKPTICIGENKDADQLRGNPGFVSDLFGNHIVGFPTRRLICCRMAGRNRLFFKLPSSIDCALQNMHQN